MKLTTTPSQSRWAPSDLRALTRTFPHAGSLIAIHLRPGRHEPIIDVDTCEAIAGRGLRGDRAIANIAGGKRQVTLLQAEHVPTVAAFLRLASINTATLRRNLVVSGLNIAAGRALFKDQPVRLRIGPSVIVEISGPCEPCSRMEAALGPGAYNALRGHGGFTAKVIAGGTLALGDRVLCEVVQADLFEAVS
jgi:MOSC domain-containing protein YiiM